MRLFTLILIFVLLLLIQISYFKRYYYSLNNLYMLCKKLLLNNYNTTFREDINTGYDLWLYMLKRNLSENCKLFEDMGLIKIEEKIIFNSIYGYYRSNYEEKHSSFPDSSYVRISANKYKKEDILFGTYDFQHYLFNYQHPQICNDKKFLIIQGWKAGHCSELHILASYLTVAIESNRIAIFDPRYKSNVADGNYCKNKYKNWNCYLEPLTNCTLTLDDINQAVPYINKNQPDFAVILNNTQKYLYKFPSIIYSFFSNYHFSKKFYLIYWNIQSVTYIFRINKRTYNYLNRKIPYINFVKKKNYMNVWIRHGDKYREMKLIPTNLYDSSIKYFSKIWGFNYLYISSDDPEAVEYYINKYNSFYLKYKRYKYPYPYSSIEHLTGDNLTLNVIADLIIALSSNGFAGTLRSNIARIINELRMTVGYKLNSPYFEVGSLKNSIIFSHSFY